MLQQCVCRCVQTVLVTALACLASVAPANAQELTSATVAVLLPVDVEEDPVCIVFDGGEPQCDSLRIEQQTGDNGPWQHFGNAVLAPTDAIYVTRSGRHLGVVWAIDIAHPLPEHGVMLWGGNGYVTGVLGRYVKIVDGVLYDVHGNMDEATHRLTIWAGLVRG